MGIMDTVKGLFAKGKGYAAQNPDKVDQYIEKAGDAADAKTGGKYAQQVDKAQDAVRKNLGTGPAPGSAPQGGPDSAPPPSRHSAPPPSPETGPAGPMSQ